MKLLEFGAAIVFSGAYVKVAMLVVAPVRELDVELQFDVHGIGREEVVKMVGVGEDVELVEEG